MFRDLDLLGMTKLLVGTGTFDGLQSVEVVNLDEANPDLICDNLPDIPVGPYRATGQLFQVLHLC